MSTLRQSLDDYLAVRRAVGYKLEDAARILASFVALPDARPPDKGGNCRVSGGLVLAGGRVCPVLLLCS